MSNQPQQPQPLVSPEAYVSAQFGEACQEISANPQEVFQLLLFSFLQITPEERGAHHRGLKHDFNIFAGAVDFKSLEATIDEQIKQAELGLYDALSGFWERQ